MKRTKNNPSKPKLSLAVQQQVISEILSRRAFSRDMGFQFGDKRKVYEALGYPGDGDLTFEYFYGKYERQDIARAVIDRPCDSTWKGDVAITEPGKSANDSALNKKWKELDDLLSIKKRLNKVDKLCELGRFSILLLGLDDVKTTKDFKMAVNGSRKLLYVKQYAESEVEIHTSETNPKNPRYGLPVLYIIKSVAVFNTGTGVTTTTTTTEEEIYIHHSRLLHYVTGNLTSEVYGVSKLKPIINRLVDLEKILGGDAEMFWRGARPGYTATAKDDYDLGTTEEEDLLEELDKYEHDLRRFIVAKGMDIKALEQQVADPSSHVDVQLQAISAQTGIPKRVLVGSERGELASTQDKDQWKELIKTRQEEHAEPTILRPLIDLLMKYKVLPLVKDFNVVWDDIFAPSDTDKVEVGKKRSESLKAYADSALSSEILPPRLALKYLLGLNEEQVEEAIKEMDAQLEEEDRLFNRIAQQEKDFAPKEVEEVEVSVEETE